MMASRKQKATYSSYDNSCDDQWSDRVALSVDEKDAHKVMATLVMTSCGGLFDDSFPIRAAMAKNIIDLRRKGNMSSS